MDAPAVPNKKHVSSHSTASHCTPFRATPAPPCTAHAWGQGTAAAQPIDFTTGPATTAAFVHLSFGINVWNPQLTVAMFNKPGIKALFAQSIKNAVPGEHCVFVWWWVVFVCNVCLQLSDNAAGNIGCSLSLSTQSRAPCIYFSPTCLTIHPTLPLADAVVVSEPLPATRGVLVRSTVRFQADAASAKAQADTLVKYLTDATLLKQMLPEANWHPVLVYTTFPYLVGRR